MEIRTGITSTSLMLEHLGSYPRANGLALALREISRVERTLFNLGWIDDLEERRRATRGLIKGEAQNALKRAIFFHHAGHIRDPGLQAQEYRASAPNLVASAIVLWNTTYPGAAMRQLERQRRPVPPDLLQHLSAPGMAAYQPEWRLPLVRNQDPQGKAAAPPAQQDSECTRARSV